MSKRKKTGAPPERSGSTAPDGAALPNPPPHSRRMTLGICLLLMALIAAFLLTGRAERKRVSPAAGAPVPPAATMGMAPQEQALRARLQSRPNDPLVHEALARYLLENHRPFEALWQFGALQDLQSNAPSARLGMSRALVQAGFPPRAIEILISNPASTPSAIPDSDAALARAEAALATAQPAQAVAALTSGGWVVNSTAAQRLLGDARMAAGDTAGAAAAYRRGTSLEPGSAVGYDRLGRLELAADQWAAAGKAFAAARDREPQDPGHLYRLGLATERAGDVTGAEGFWQEAVAMSPQYAPAHVALGRLEYSRRNLRAAAMQLVAAVKIDPSSEAAQLTLAQVMTAQGDPASALYQRGFYDLETDRPHLALTEFHRMIAAAPNRIDGPLMASLACIQMKRPDLAAAEVRQGLARHPNDPRLLGRLGILHVLGGDQLRARQLCEAWLKADPQAVEPYRIMCRVDREEQRLPEAVQAGEQALAREPQNAAVCCELSKALSALPGPDNRRRALELARQAAALNPREADHWHQLGVLLRGARQQEEAAAALLHALELNPTSTESCSLLVQVAAQEQRPATAAFFARLVSAIKERAGTDDALWKAVYQRPNDAAAHERLAQELLAHADLRRARYQLQQAAALEPAGSAAQRELAVVERLLAIEEP